MTSYAVSEWISSTGGPLVIMSESKAQLWTGLNGVPSDYDLACQSPDYTSKLILHDTEVLVLGDEPLRTAVVTFDSYQIIVRQKWAENDDDILSAIAGIDINSMDTIENLLIEWTDRQLVLFDSVDVFSECNCVRLCAYKGVNFIKTFIYHPYEKLSLLLHLIVSA